MKTVIVNAFGGPGAGKTTAAWELAAGLKKEGLVVEYVSEYAKELVWDEDFSLLDGSLENQKRLYAEQKRRIDRLVGKVDAVITDSPILLNLMYLKEESKEHEQKVLSDFMEYNNFNFFVERGKVFEKQGRIHDLAESIEKDNEIKGFFEKHDIYCGTYSHARLSYLVDNIKRYHYGLQHGDITAERKDNIMDASNKVNISISQKYVQTGLQNKQVDGTYREYNKVTLPANTVIDGKNVGGFQFYPLYANISVYNPNSMHIPLLKDTPVLLHKEGETIEVEPQTLADAIKESYKQWKLEHTQLGNLQQEQLPSKEFEWQGKPYRDFIKDYICAGLDEMEGSEIEASNLISKFTEEDIQQGMMFLGGEYEAREFIREYFYEAVDAREEMLAVGDGIGSLTDPLIDSEKFAMAMVEHGICDELGKVDFVNEIESMGGKITIDKPIIDLIKKGIGRNEAALDKHLHKEKGAEADI